MAAQPRELGVQQLQSSTKNWRIPLESLACIGRPKSHKSVLASVYLGCLWKGLSILREGLLPPVSPSWKCLHTPDRTVSLVSQS